MPARIFPDHSDAARLDRAMTLHQLGRLDEAELEYRLIMAASPDNDAVRHLLGVLAYHRGQDELAMARIGEAIAMNPLRAHYHFNLGLARARAGRHAAALAAFAEAFRLDPRSAEAQYNAGNVLRELGRTDEAARAFRLAVRLRPDYVEALANLGSLLVQAGRPRQAEAPLRAALRLRPDLAEIHSNLGQALMLMGQLDEAMAALNEAVRRDAALAAGWFNLGLLGQRRHQPEQAEHAFCHAAALRPDHAEAQLGLGEALRTLHRHAEAAACFIETLRLQPDLVAARLALGNTLREAGDLAGAEACLRDGVARHPEHAEAHNDLGNVLLDRDRVPEAVAAYQRAVALRPGFALAHNHLGVALRMAGDAAGAEAGFREALRLQPDYAAAAYNLATLHLVEGRYAEGWEGFEARLRAFPVPSRAAPTWRGGTLRGQVLLVHAEQGMGDTIQFCRYLRLIPARHGVLFEVPPALARLLAGLEGVDRLVVAEDGPVPPHDLQVPLMSLPHLLRPRWGEVPGGVPYLRAPAAEVAHWRGRLAALPGLLVGIAWAGNPAYPNDRRRSMPLATLATLADLPGVALVSLQKGAAAAELAALPPWRTVHDWTAELGDFAATAALIEALDLVIAVDTAVVHLAGALGRPVWLLNRFDPCWRWLHDRADSPWYPSLRQFRQPRLGDWEGVMAQVATALINRKAARREAATALSAAALCRG